MLTITASEASRGFSALLDEIEDGAEPFTITRGKRAVAVISPIGAVSNIAPVVRPAHRRYETGLIKRIRSERPTGEVLDELRGER